MVQARHTRTTAARRRIRRTSRLMAPIPSSETALSKHRLGPAWQAIIGRFRANCPAVPGIDALDGPGGSDGRLSLEASAAMTMKFPEADAIDRRQTEDRDDRAPARPGQSRAAAALDDLHRAQPLQPWSCCGASASSARWSSPTGRISPRSSCCSMSRRRCTACGGPSSCRAKATAARRAARLVDRRRRDGVEESRGGGGLPRGLVAGAYPRPWVKSGRAGRRAARPDVAAARAGGAAARLEPGSARSPATR